MCVTKLITLNGNTAKTGCLARVLEKSTDASDTEACGGDCYSLESLVIRKRNNATMDKFGLKIKCSPAKCKPGNWLFASKPLSVGTEFPAKGPFFDTVAEMEKWVSTAPHQAAPSLALKAVELWFQGSEAGESCVKYKVLNQLIGFVNDFHGIAQRPNAVLAWNPDRPLGQHSLL